MSSSILPNSVWGGPVRVHDQRTNRWNTDVSTADTVRNLCRLARTYATDPAVMAATRGAISALATGSSQRDICSAIFHWVRATVRFVEDEQLLYEELGVQPADLDQELLIVPPVLLAMPQPMGDCDDFSLLISSMCLSAGVQPFYVTVAADASDPFKFSHIYVCAKLADEGTYFPLDAGNRLNAVPPGWESDAVTRKAVWKI